MKVRIASDLVFRKRHQIWFSWLINIANYFYALLLMKIDINLVLHKKNLLIADEILSSTVLQKTCSLLMKCYRLVLRRRRAVTGNEMLSSGITQKTCSLLIKCFCLVLHRRLVHFWLIETAMQIIIWHENRWVMSWRDRVLKNWRNCILVIENVFTELLFSFTDDKNNTDLDIFGFSANCHPQLNSQTANEARLKICQLSSST